MTLASPLKTVIGNAGSIIAKKCGMGGYFQRVRANGADLFVTALVTIYGETADDPDVDLCAAGEIPSGVIWGPSSDVVDLDKDSDDAYADNTFLQMYIWARGDQIWLTGTTNTSLAITRGGGVHAAAGFLADSTIGTHHIIGQAQTGQAVGVTQQAVILVLMF